MEKVKLTSLQANEIEALMREPFNNTKDELLVGHTAHGGFSKLKALGVDLPLLAKALYIGYEVEPEFEVGEWAFNKQTNRFFEVAEGYEDKMNLDIIKKYLRHATPEEIAEEKKRRWWKSHNRNVWELKRKDVLYDKEIGQIVEVSEDSTMEKYGREIYKVICFSHDRKDVDNE